MAKEEVLHGGVANAGGVVRLGDHVLRPSNPHSTSIHRMLRSLGESGFTGAWVPLGIDPDGRERLVFIPGDVAICAAFPRSSPPRTTRALSSSSGPRTG